VLAWLRRTLVFDANVLQAVARIGQQAAATARSLDASTNPALKRLIAPPTQGEQAQRRRPAKCGYTFGRRMCRAASRGRRGQARLTIELEGVPRSISKAGENRWRVSITGEERLPAHADWSTAGDAGRRGEGRR